MPKRPPNDPRLIETARAQTYLRAWRKHKKLSQEEAASLFGIDRTTLGRIETAKLPYNQDLLERAALAYGCRPEDLLAADPATHSLPDLISNKLRAAPPDMQKRVLDIVEVLLKT